MELAPFVLTLACIVSPLRAQDLPENGPTNDKAKKTYRDAVEYLSKHNTGAALDAFKKADKQDGGRCRACQERMVRYGLELHEWKTAQAAAEEMVTQAQGPQDTAIAQYHLGVVLFEVGVNKRKDEIFSQAHEEFSAALASMPIFPQALLADGRALAYLKQDDAAKARFQQFIEMKPKEGPEKQRVLRYISEPALARARMAPAFAVTTLDGQEISLDDLQGKVVLIDFWATWCGPCREALPHVRDIARKFQGQPLIVLSVSLDDDEGKWEQFVAKNEMTWPQYRDGGFSGRIAKLFDVQAIPHTFTIDADGVLQDEHVGDASIEGKLKKLVKRAEEVQAAAIPRQ
jgi:thiol-disulfide isomerase/thioredoxin/Tfp pilus assembly protein PilF